MLFHFVTRYLLDIFNQGFGSFSTMIERPKIAVLCVYSKVVKSLQTDVGGFESLCKAVHSLI